MSFNTWPFLIFLLAVFFLYWLIPGNSKRFNFLILASLSFITYHFPLNTVIYLGFALLIFFVGFLIDKSNRLRKKKCLSNKILLTIGILASFSFLSFYKYRFFIFNALSEIGIRQAERYLPPGEFVSYLVPIGISFFIFEVVHFLVEIYKSNIKNPRLRDFFLFVFFFPTMIAGPIKRFGNFSVQLPQLSRPNKKIIIYSFKRIIIGLTKKILIADFLVIITNLIFSHFKFFSPAQYLLAVYIFSLVIYLDFSGYSDVAIGISRLLGLKIPENFNSPYTKPNISDFWTSWHISLTSWIKDYLFIPLGGNRKGFSRYLLNLILVFGVVGLWHGASWNFVFWGIFHGLGIGFYQTYKRLTAKIVRLNKPNTISRAGSIFLTFNFVSFGWVLFKMSLPDTLFFWKNIFFSPIGLIFLSINVLAVLGILLKPNFSPIDQYRHSWTEKLLEKEILYLKVKDWGKLFFFSTAIYFLAFFFSETTVPYIYEQF